MMQISWIVIIVGLLIGYGSTRSLPEDVSVSMSENEFVETTSEVNGLLSGLDMVENAEMMSSNVESLVDMDSMTNINSMMNMDSMTNMDSLMNMDSMMNMDSLAEMESLAGMDSLVNTNSMASMDLLGNTGSLMNAESLMNMDSIMDNASSLMDYTSLINQDSFMSLSEKARYLQQLTQFSPMQMGMVTDLFGMLRDRIVSHYQFKLSVIRAAKEQLAKAMQAMASGDASAVSSHIMSVISDLRDCCPICKTLKYALNEDPSMLPFVGGLSQSILSRMEVDASESIDADLSISE